MSALNPSRRKRTAREIAAEVGLSERTVVRLVAEPRSEYERRAKARRSLAVKLRLQGLTYHEIAARADTTTGIVGCLLAQARRNGEWAAAQTAAGMTNASDARTARR